MCLTCCLNENCVFGSSYDHPAPTKQDFIVFLLEIVVLIIKAIAKQEDVGVLYPSCLRKDPKNLYKYR